MNTAKTLTIVTFSLIPNNTVGSTPGTWHVTMDHNRRINYMVEIAVFVKSSQRYNRVTVDIMDQDGNQPVELGKVFVYPTEYGTNSHTLRLLVHKYLEDA